MTDSPFVFGKLEETARGRLNALAANRTWDEHFIDSDVIALFNEVYGHHVAKLVEALDDIGSSDQDEAWDIAAAALREWYQATLTAPRFDGGPDTVVEDEDEVVAEIHSIPAEHYFDDGDPRRGPEYVFRKPGEKQRIAVNQRGLGGSRKRSGRPMVEVGPFVGVCMYCCALIWPGVDAARAHVEEFHGGELVQ